MLPLIRERRGQGSLADYVVGHMGTVAHAPMSIPLAETAALPVVALTAWEMLAEETTVVDDGAVEPHIAERFAFDDVAEPHRPGEEGDFLGKLLLVNE